jgi:hypothetical protein
VSQRRTLVISKCSDTDSVRLLVEGMTVVEISTQEWSRALVSPTTHKPGDPKVLPFTPMAGLNEISQGLAATSMARSMASLSNEEIAMQNTLLAHLNEQEENDHREGA